MTFCNYTQVSIIIQLLKNTYNELLFYTWMVMSQMGDTWIDFPKNVATCPQPGSYRDSSDEAIKKWCLEPVC